MKFIGLVLTVVCLGGCSIPGNALGLQGEYSGIRTEDASGTVTNFGVTTTTSTISGSFESTATLSLEGAFTSDAILFNIGGCAVPLDADGDSLALVEETECFTEQSITTTAGANSTLSKRSSTTKVTSVTVSISRDRGIVVDAEYDVDSSEESGGEQTSESSIGIELSFEGERVASE